MTSDIPFNAEAAGTFFIKKKYTLKVYYNLL